MGVQSELGTSASSAATRRISTRSGCFALVCVTVLGVALVATWENATGRRGSRGAWPLQPQFVLANMPPDQSMALSILDACASEQLAEADPMRRELINDRCQGELRKVVGKENFVFLKDWKAKVVAKGVNEQGLGWVDLRFSQYVYAVPIANQALDSTSPCFGALAARDVGDVITFSGSMVPLIAASSLPGEGRLSAEVAASAPRGSRVLNINLEEVDGVDCATGRLASRPTPTPFPHPTPVPIPQPSNEEHDPVRPMPPKAIRTGVPYFPPNAVPFSEFMGDAGKPGRSRMMAPPFKAVIREFVTGRDGQRWLRCELSYGKSKPFTGWISESAFVEAAFR